MKSMLVKALAQQQLGIKDPRLLNIIAQIAEQKLTLCEFIESWDTTHLCFLVGEVNHVRVEIKGLAEALRNAGMAPVIGHKQG